MSSTLSIGEESQRIQQIFTQSLKSQINVNSPSKQYNVTRKSSFYKSSPSNQLQIDDIFEQINSIQLCNLIAQKLVGKHFNSLNLKNMNKMNSGLQLEKNEKGFPCVSFFVESQQVSINSYEKDNSTKFTAHAADLSQNIFNRQTTDTYSPSPIYYSQRQAYKQKLDIIEREDDNQDGQIQIDLQPQKIQQPSLHNFPKTKSIIHINQNESRKQSLISNLNSTNEIYKIEEVGLLDNTNGNLNQYQNVNKKILNIPKSLSCFEYNAATTTAQSTHNQDDLDENNQQIPKNARQTVQLENIPENQILEQSKEVTQNDENSSIQKKNQNYYEQTTAIKYLDKDTVQTKTLDGTDNQNKNNVFQTISDVNKDQFFQNKQITFNKSSHHLSDSMNSPRNKKKSLIGGVEYNSYKDLPSSINLSQNGFNQKENTENRQSAQDSIIYLQTNDKQNLTNPFEKEVNQNQSSQQVLLKTGNDQQNGEQTYLNKLQQNKKIDLNLQIVDKGLTFSQDNQSKNLLTVNRNQQNVDLGMFMYQNQTTPLFSAASNSKNIPKLEIAQSMKQSPSMLASPLEKKQILFVDKHSLYHTQFQQVLSQYAKDQEDETFQSAYTVEECINIIENQYNQYKYQYPYIFIDNKMLNDGNNSLIELIKNIFQTNKVKFESLIFICSNQYLDSSSYLRLGITSSFKKPITLSELEDKRIILQKKQSTTTISQSFSPQLHQKNEHDIYQ